MTVSGAHDLLDGVAGHGVKEKYNHSAEQERQQRLDDRPLVVVPQDVADRLERVEEPDERRVGSTATNVTLTIPQSFTTKSPNFI